MVGCSEASQESLRLRKCQLCSRGSHRGPGFHFGHHARWWARSQRGHKRTWERTVVRGQRRRDQDNLWHGDLHPHTEATWHQYDWYMGAKEEMWHKQQSCQVKGSTLHTRLFSSSRCWLHQAQDAWPYLGDARNVNIGCKRLDILRQICLRVKVNERIRWDNKLTWVHKVIVENSMFPALDS